MTLMRPPCSSMEMSAASSSFSRPCVRRCSAVKREALARAAACARAAASGAPPRCHAARRGHAHPNRAIERPVLGVGKGWQEAWERPGYILHGHTCAWVCCRWEGASGRGATAGRLLREAPAPVVDAMMAFTGFFAACDDFSPVHASPWIWPA